MKHFLKTAAVGLFALLASALPLLAQAEEQTHANNEGGGVAGAIGGLIGLLVGVVMVVAMWKIFTKAGQPGWGCLIPIYNWYLLLKIAGRPGWWLVLMFIPFVNFVIIIIVSLDLAKSFGKGAGFGIGLILLSPIFFPILGFGDAKYVGPAAGAPVAA
jgi:hypothetical protein